MLSSVSLVLSRMSDVARAAFWNRRRSHHPRHRERVVGQDLAGRCHLPGHRSAGRRHRVPRRPRGNDAFRTPSRGGGSSERFPESVVRFHAFRRSFVSDHRTPVYVQTARGPGLLNVLVAGYAVDAAVAQHLKEATGGSEFVFVLGDAVVASTLASPADQQIREVHPASQALGWVDAGSSRYAMLATPLPDVQGKPVGELAHSPFL